MLLSWNDSALNTVALLPVNFVLIKSPVICSVILAAVAGLVVIAVSVYAVVVLLIALTICCSGLVVL